MNWLNLTSSPAFLSLVIVVGLATTWVGVMVMFWRQRRWHAHLCLILEEQQSHWQTMQLDMQRLSNEEREVVSERINAGQLAVNKLIADSIQGHMKDVREQINHSFSQHANSLTSHLRSLTEEIRNHLHRMTKQVNEQLSEGLEKTSATFQDVLKRLTIIDQAQQKITELSTHVVSLQDVLTDKRSRGAFGEVQLAGLIENMIPANHFKMQHTLSNGKRADCILFLPNPTGNIVIDAKFPLETFQKINQAGADAPIRKTLQQQFRQDILKHINDIADKYIIPEETSDGAVMFIPAEAIFAEIHANYPDLVSKAHQRKVWMVSPSTLMAVLTTARAVLKDDATKKQVHIIQEHLQHLAVDFQRFEKRMDNLSRHIEQAHKDVSEVHISAKKITSRFVKIESVEFDKPSEELEHDITDD
ncbi:DNA recombination protein RmuC [Legionella sp. W05-934-2]|jgi:DNA recombination protein RmuC|uniref:DNA recombination protein RmuC n=1 Tax=Legionella sp. W05-934-2 TaxID=1198649 RepID=UPI0034618C87